MTRETAEFFGTLKVERPDAFAMILTQSKPEIIEQLLVEKGYGRNDYLITKVPPTEIPKYLSGADIAVSFIKNCYSKQASSPTKNAEYLACGLPIVANSGIGDVDTLILGKRVGAIIEDFSPESYRAAITALRRLGDNKEHFRTVARSEFDLEKVGGERYRRIYERLVKQ